MEYALGAFLLGSLTSSSSVCVRRLAAARRGIAGFGRFLANPRVSVEALIEGWGERMASTASQQSQKEGPSERGQSPNATAGEERK